MVAFGLDEAADNGLRRAGFINVSGVDEVNAQLARAGHDAASFGGIGLIAKHHRAQAQARDLKRAFAQ